MKKTYRFITTCAVCCAVCAAPVALTSCQFEDEDFFSESASLRVEHTNDKVQQLLVKPEHGWVMQYFCGTGVAHFEGFNILARFDKGGKVTLASNHRMLRNGQAGKYTENVSLYQLLLEDGPVLALNTWNNVLSPFVDPVSPWQAPKNIIKDGAGMQGDNNFVIMKYDDDEILLRGERYSGHTRLVPCDRPWEEYLTACDEMKNSVSSTTISNYYIMSPTDTLYLSGIRSGRVRFSERLDDPLKNDSLSAVFTPKGLRFERIDTIGTEPFQEFTLAEDSSSLVSGNVKIITCWDYWIVNTRSTVWNFDQEQFSAEQKALLEQLDAELKVWNKNASLASIGMGRSSGSNAVRGLVITFYTNTQKSKTNTAGLALTTTKTAYGTMKIAYSDEEKTDKNLAAIAAKSNAEALIRQFAATLNGTYTITPDNYFHPTSCKLTSNNATYTLK